MDNNNRSTVSQTLFRNRKGVLGIDFRSPFGVLVCALAVFVFALVSLVIVHFSLKADHERAVRTYRENNWLKTTAQADGTTLVSGKSSGTSYQYIEDNRIIPGVTISGVPVGGMDYENARNAMLDALSAEFSKINISVTVDNVTIVLTASDFRITTNINELLSSAFKLGRSDADPYQNYLKRIEIAENGFEVGSYTIRMDEESVAAIVSEAAAQLDHPPIEPYVTLLNRVGGGKPGYGTGGDISTVCKTQTVKAPDGTVIGEILFHTGSNGFCLNREDMLKQISEAFNSGNYNASLSLLLEEVEPEGDVNTLIDSMRELSRFSTEFATSNESRSRNVQKAAGLLNCVILEPGEELSYNELLGPRTEELGWLPAHGISGGKEYIDTPGGGICQVSSTLYNSLLLIGPDIRIVSRSHHSIPGSYVAMGLDATVSYYGPDLVWSNAAESPMFLFAYADMRTKTVYTFVYGTQPDDGTHYKIWSDTIEKLDPPEPKRIAEPLWPTGYSKMVISPRYGYVVEVYRQLIGADGQPAGDVEKLYTDKYVPVQGELHYGTGSSTLPVPNR